MAYQIITLPSFTYMHRTVSIAVHADSLLALTTPTKNTVVSIGDSVERLDVVAGTYEMQNLEVTVVDNYDNEPEGFWRRVFNGAEVPRLWILLDEGAGNTVYMIGSAVVNAAKWDDKYLSSDSTQFVRHMTFTIADIITTMQNVSVDDVATECLNHTVIDNLFSTKPNITSFDYSGAGTATVGYRIAACSSTDEDIWSTEVVTNTAPNGWGSVTVHWSAVSGVDHYVVYRTTDTVSQGIGRIGTAAALSYPQFTDTGFSPTASTQKTRTYVCIQDIMAAFIAVAFGQTFARANAIMTENVNNLRFSSSNVSAVNAHSLYVPVDSMTSGNSLYWGARYANAWDLFFALCKNFALVPRHYYDLTVSPNLHKIEFLTRENAYSTTISFANTPMSGDHSPDNLAKIASVECHRASGKNKYPVGTPVDAASYDLSVACEYVASNTVGVNQTAGAAVLFGGYTIPKLYISSIGGFSSGIAYVANGSEYEAINYTGAGTEGGLAYLANVTAKNSFSSSGKVYPGDPEVSYGERLYTYNGTSVQPVTSAGYWDASTGSLQAETSGDLLLAALRDYLYARLATKKQRYRKSFGNIAATEGATTSHANVHICKRMNINNGIASLTHYASEVRKSLMANTAEIEWIQE